MCDDASSPPLGAYGGGCFCPSGPGISGPDDAYCIRTGPNSIANSGSFDAIRDQSDMAGLILSRLAGSGVEAVSGFRVIKLSLASIDDAFEMDRMPWLS